MTTTAPRGRERTEPPNRKDSTPTGLIVHAADLPLGGQIIDGRRHVLAGRAYSDAAGDNTDAMHRLTLVVELLRRDLIRIGGRL